MSVYLLWHEGALGDLLLTRLAVAALGYGLQGELFLCARHAARFLFKEAGLVHHVAPTYPGPDFWIKRIRPTAVFVFGGPRLEELFQGLGPQVHTIDTRPKGGKHLALQMLEQVLRILGSPGLREKALAHALCLAHKGKASGPLWLHPGSGGRFKCAPAGWTKALGKMLEKEGLETGFILGPAEIDLLEVFAEDRRCVFANGDLVEVCSLLKEACGIVGFDSGLTHLAGCLGLPTVAIFGPTPWRNWSPLGPKVLIISQRCLCRHQGVDPRQCQDPCLGHLPLEQVAQLIYTFFNTTARCPWPGLEKADSGVGLFVAELSEQAENFLPPTPVVAEAEG